MASNSKITICTVAYGDHARLVRRFLDGLRRFTPEQFALRIGLNAACPETVALAHAVAVELGNTWVHSEPRNIYKAPLMGKLFTLRPLETEWVVWFDDDSYPYRGDWLAGLKLKIESHPEIDVWGNVFFTEADEAATEFIQTASWFRGLPFNHDKPSGGRSERPLLAFVEGGFWAAKTSVLHALSWPDPRLVQNEDDYIFGEALRQNGFKIGRYKSGVRISQAERRCPRHTPSSYRSPASVTANGGFFPSSPLLS